jgi:hypothetical protein
MRPCGTRARATLSHITSITITSSSPSSSSQSSSQPRSFNAEFALNSVPIIDHDVEQLDEATESDSSKYFACCSVDSADIWVALLRVLVNLTHNCTKACEDIAVASSRNSSYSLINALVVTQGCRWNIDAQCKVNRKSKTRKRSSTAEMAFASPTCKLYNIALSPEETALDVSTIMLIMLLNF